MTSAFEATNPFEFWARANMAAAAATMELFKATTTATTAMLGAGSTRQATGASTGATSRVALRDGERSSYEARVAEIRGSTAAPAMPSTRSSTGKSWYRAPYRSPFDPLFWMTPGHPADHVSDWLRPAMAAGAAFGNPFAQQFTQQSASPMPDWQSAAWMSPMAMWANMMPIADAGSGAAQRARSNVVDFEAAYSAYRTAGGHASAQILADRSDRRIPVASVPSTPAWGLPFLMFGWPPRFG